MKYSKGPWTYNKRLAEDGDKSTEMYGKSRELQEPVCIVPHDDITEEGYREVKANAELISHAPKLIAVLTKLVKDSLATDFNEHWDSYKEAEQLVRKLS